MAVGVWLLWCWLSAKSCTARCAKYMVQSVECTGKCGYCMPRTPILPWCALQCRTTRDTACGCGTC